MNTERLSRHDVEMRILAELERRRREKFRKPLLDYVPLLSPQYHSPRHLKPLTDYLDRMLVGEAFQILCSTPPRHGKTETLLHFAVQYLNRYPDRKVAYISYDTAIAVTKSIIARRLATRSLLRIGDRDSQTHWETKLGGAFHAIGAGGSITGHGFHIIIVDDPIKNAMEAYSQLQQERLYDWFVSVVMTRKEPNASVIVNMARWDINDLIGRIEKNEKENWIKINLPAFNEIGGPLWKERFTIEDLFAIQKRSEYFFQALYMGNPRPKGSTVFTREIPTYTKAEMPAIVDYSIGLDFAYGKNPLSDYSVIVILGKGEDGNIYWLDMVRERYRSDEFLEVLKWYRAKYPTAMFAAYASNVEKGLIDLMNAKGLSILHYPATTNKFIRAQSVASAWNSGKIKIPSDLPRDTDWTNVAMAEITGFTGKNDFHDDIVDALASAYEVYAVRNTLDGWEKKFQKKETQ